ncbi:MAG: sodium/solute symporter [Pirellulales bacterium]|nr:sodium/solute symporter [Pirellulales bacterium]
MGLVFLFLVGLSLAGTSGWAESLPETCEAHLDWSAAEPLPPLPDGRTGQKTALGVAGPFAGVHRDRLIVAGGANFPASLPWIPSEVSGKLPHKIYYDTVFVLSRENGREPTWSEAAVHLPAPLAYGVSIPTPKGLLCIGGERKTYRDNEKGSESSTTHRSEQVFLLAWNPVTESMEVLDRYIEPPERAGAFHSFPPLPEPTTMLGGAVINSKVFVVGGDTRKGATASVWMLDLKGAKIKKDQEGNVTPWRWHPQPPIPGPPRVLPVIAAQNDGTATNLYVFSGRTPGSPENTAILTDAYSFNPGKQRWKRLRDVGAPTESRSVMAGSALPSGQYGILVFGGDPGDLFLKILRLEAEVRNHEAAGNREAAVQSRSALNQVRGDTHRGFSRDVLAYHTVTDAWAKLKNPIPASRDPDGGAEPPRGGPVTTTAVRWGDQILLPTGEIRPGVRSGQMLQAVPVNRNAFDTVNTTVLVVYLVVLVIIGFYFSRRIHSTDDFFKAGGRIPWWAAGVSIFGTQLSALTFMAIPAKTFATDWRYFPVNMTIIAVAPFIIFLFLPFYRRLNVTTAYEYLEMRFNLPVRLIGSAMFMLFQFGRIGIVLLLPSIALSVVTGIEIELCILLMGLLCILYTVMGGIEAVIWTDVLQVVVLVGGALLCLVLIPARIDGGWSETLALAGAADKLRLLDFRWDLKDATFFTLVISGFGLQLISYGTDQTVIQRYLTTKDESSAGRAIWTNAALTIPATLLFFSIGSLLYAFYRVHPQAMDPTLESESAIFPLFIVTQLPLGVAGLVVAAIFAAAMSSLDSSMNSVSAAVTTDFYQRLGKNVTSQSALRTARWMTVLIGGSGIVFALWMAAQPDIRSLWDEFSKIIGLFGGGLGGVFLLGIFTRRGTGAGALAGILASGILQYAIKETVPLHAWAYGATGILSCFVIGYLVSVLVPRGRRDLSGLTLYTQQPRSGEKKELRR